jgi:SpoU rRNA methylase family enzyme
MNEKVKHFARIASGIQHISHIWISEISESAAEIGVAHKRLSSIGEVC